MKKTVSMNDFFEAFDKHQRLNQFPHTLAMLFDYLEEYEADTGEEMELDVIGLCCDFTEWSIPDLADEFGTDNEQIKQALRYAYNDRTHWSGDGLGYVVLSEANFEDLKLLVDQREEESNEEKREAIAEALEDLASNINAIARDVEDDPKPIPEMLEELEGYIDDFIHDYKQDVEEFKD